jgi:hypothetical protein
VFSPRSLRNFKPSQFLKSLSLINGGLFAVKKTNHSLILIQNGSIIVLLDRNNDFIIRIRPDDFCLIEKYHFCRRD